MKIKKGDTVMVIAGKDKGKTGAVTETRPTQRQVVVEGINIATKHHKSRRVRSQGQIIERPMPIDVSNVALVENDQPVRVGYTVTDGKKVRVSKKTGKAI